MKALALLLATLILLCPVAARGQETVPVAREDLAVFLQLAREEKCRQTTVPTVTADPITITVDRQGRVFASGSGPRPFTVKTTWCKHTIEAKGQVEVWAARMPEPTWGWRFRPKATAGYLPITAWKHGAKAGLDAGVLLEPFYWRSLNLNGYVGIGAVGAGLGLDLTKNLGAYLGYAMTWTGQSNVHAAVSLALW